MSFAQMVIDTRTAKGINQIEMAKTIGLDVSVYNRIERGLRDCRVDELVKIANALGVTTDFLLERGDNMGIVGTRLRKLREKKGLSQGEVSKVLGMSRPAYNYYENSKTALPRELAEIAKFFNVSTDYLLGIDERDITDKSDSPCVQANLPPEGKQLLGSFNNAPTHIKAAILTLLAPYEKGGAAT